MAFDIVGINPQKAHSKCLRFNIWKWNDLRLVLKKFHFFNDVDEHCFMSNDGYIVSGEQLKNLISILTHVKLISEIESGNQDWFLEKIYQSSENIDIVVYHGDCPGFNGGKLNYSDILILLLFLSGCDGFEIR